MSTLEKTSFVVAANRLPVRWNEDQEEWACWLEESALKFHVSTIALQWRLVQLGVLHKDAVDATQHWSTEHDATEDKPRLFSLEFLKTLNGAIDAGRISVRRASMLVGLSIDELANLFNKYSLKVPFDM